MHDSLSTSGKEMPRALAFDVAPLLLVGILATVAAVTGPGWSQRIAALPWIISLVVVGMPHGAADLALSRGAFRGWTLCGVWVAYLAAMVSVAVVLLGASRMALIIFAAMSCWHFGAARRASAGERLAGGASLWGIVAHGCVVLAMPLAAWPAATRDAATDLVTLVAGHQAATAVVTETEVRTAGLVLAALTVLAGAAAGVASAGDPETRRDWRHGVLELAVIAGLGWFTEPLFSVGLYFLVWHSWRQMEPLAASLMGASPGSWSRIGRAVVRVHRDALPLLVPAWILILVAWWRLAPGHGFRELALVSIAAYLVVTPAHEILGDLVHRTLRGRDRPAASRARQAAARPVSRRWAAGPTVYEAATSRKAPILRNFS